MLKVYKLVRTDNVGYDEYDECVVVAENEQEALKIGDENYHYFKEGKTEIIEIDLNKAREVMGSFCAG